MKKFIKLILFVIPFFFLSVAQGEEKDAKPHGIVKIGKRETDQKGFDTINFIVINPFKKEITVRVTFKGAKNPSSQLITVRPGQKDKNTELLKKGASHDFDATYEVNQ